MSNVPEVLRPEYYFDMDLMECKDLFDGASFVWEVVKNMQKVTPVDTHTQKRCQSVNNVGKNTISVVGSVDVRIGAGAIIGPNVTIYGDGGIVSIDEGAEIRPGSVIIAGGKAVYIGSGSKIGPNAHIDATKGSVCVGEKATLRQGSYLRELSVIASKATIGNSCEIKCALIGPQAEVPHFNYVGDSILGYKAHMGAGVKISNLKITPDPNKVNTIKMKHEGEVYDSGMRKFGVALGDKAQMGCNSVANPGTFVGRNVLIYTCSSVVGFIPENTIIKLRQKFEQAVLNV